MKGFYVKHQEYFYSSDTNTLINSELVEVYRNYLENRKIKSRKATIDEAMIRSNVADLNGIIFEVTQSCNLRCKYCVYSGNVYYNQRSHSSTSLDIQTARKAVDYFANIKKGRRDEPFSISFYGGEALLNFNLIREIVDYSEGVLPSLNLEFALTTNGTLLNRDIIQYLIEKDFRLYISLDGPRDIHDSKRVFKNGGGTFDRIMENLALIREIDADYFREKLCFNATYSKDLSFPCVSDFFINNPLVSGVAVKLSSVNESYTDYYKLYPYDRKRLIENTGPLLDEAIEKRKNGLNMHPIERNRIVDLEVMQDALKKRKYKNLADTCIFNSRIYVDVEGTFHVCEKMSDHMPIGNVNTGFDYPRMTRILREYAASIKEQCSDCDFRALCPRCLIHFSQKGKIMLDEHYCSKNKQVIPTKIEDIIRLNEPAGIEPMKANQPVYRFHQFVTVDKGPVNSVVINFLTGDIYQVTTAEIEYFEKYEYEGIPEFIDFFLEEQMLIHVPPTRWIPRFDYHDKPDAGMVNICLEIEEGVDIEELAVLFSGVPGMRITTVHFYGGNVPPGIPSNVTVTVQDKDFSRCIARNRTGEDFPIIEEVGYHWNRHYNSCWGNKLAVTKGGIVRPCIYSNIEIGNISYGDINEIMKKWENYRLITKDNVEKCKECELRYVCFDCRVCAMKKGDSINAPNPYCKYNPKTGKWEN